MRHNSDMLIYISSIPKVNRKARMETGVKVNMPSHPQPFKRNILMEVWGKKKKNSRVRQLILGKKFLEKNKKTSTEKTCLRGR